MLFSEYGIPIAEIARDTGVSTSAVSKMEIGDIRAESAW